MSSYYRGLDNELKRMGEPSLDEEYYRGKEGNHCPDCGEEMEFEDIEDDEPAGHWVCKNTACGFEPEDEMED